MLQESVSKDSSNNVNVCGGNAGVMASRDRAMTFWISPLHLEVKDCALTCCPLPRASVSAASLTVLTSAGCGRPHIVRLGDI